MADPREAVRAARYGALAFEFSGTIAGGAIVGWLLDRWLGTDPYLGLACILAAVVGGFVRLVEALRHLERVDREPKP